MIKCKKILFVFSFLFTFTSYSQDSLRYRNTIFQASLSHFILVSPKYPQQENRFFPSASLSLKSARTDSLYASLKKVNFMITMGAAASRYFLSDEVVFKNFLDKHPMPIFSKRFWGGFGINYRRAISKKLILDVDLAPCVQIIVDKSEETRTDTASWESTGFEDIYEGLHLYTNLKLEIMTKSKFAFYVTLSGSVPLVNRFVDNGDIKYHNVFAAQVFAGVGISHFYKSKRRIEPTAKSKEPN